MDETHPGRDPAEEREDVLAHLVEQPVERAITLNEKVGRIPVGPARGARARERKHESCEFCEGDLWVEDGSGIPVPCKCRTRRRDRRAQARMRAGEWWRGTSLSFAAPPLSLISPEVRDATEGAIADLLAGRPTDGLWFTARAGQGKSALCAYIAQRLYPGNRAIALRLGDMLAHLRWLGAVKGALAVEQRMESLASTPLLVLDDVDRPSRSFLANSGLGFTESCMSHDLLRIAQLLRERHDAALPVVLTSRAAPPECAERCTSVRRQDLVRGLVATVAGDSDPFEDFPEYTASLLAAAFLATRREAREIDLEPPAYAAAA